MVIGLNSYEMFSEFNYIGTIYRKIKTFLVFKKSVDAVQPLQKTSLVVYTQFSILFFFFFKHQYHKFNSVFLLHFYLRVQVPLKYSCEILL